MMTTLESKRRYLSPDETASMPFLIEFQDGKRAEASSPLYVMDILVHNDFSDVNEIETLYLLCAQKLRDIAGQDLALEGVKAKVFDAAGLLFDNTKEMKNEEKEYADIEFQDETIVLDAFDPWTTVASILKTGLVKMYEKYPVWSDKSKCQGCKSCIFNTTRDGSAYCEVWESYEFSEWDRTCPFVTNGNAYSEYTEIDAEAILDGSYKHYWVPLNERKINL